MTTTEKKQKEITVGMTEELMGFLDKWMEKEIDNKPEKPGLEVKRVIVEMAKEELEKIKSRMKRINIMDDEWDKLIDKMHKISELVQWY